MASKDYWPVAKKSLPATWRSNCSERWEGVSFNSLKNNCSRGWNGAPPESMKKQLRILPLREAQGQDDRPHWDVHFHGRPFDRVDRCAINFAQDDKPNRYELMPHDTRMGHAGSLERSPVEHHFAGVA